jgi:hypothetical protein
MSSQQTENFIGRSYSEVQKMHPDLKTDEFQSINGKKYSTYKLGLEKNYTLIVVNEKFDRIVESLKIYSADNPLASENKHVNTSKYQPKCESSSTTLKYNLEKKIILLIKDDKIIFEGESELIQDRLADDKNKKCLNRWNH